MKILILGATGFVGRKVKEELAITHTVYGASQSKTLGPNNMYVDLLMAETIAKVLEEVRPEVIINCAGIVDDSEKAQQNPIFTSNLLEQVVASGQRFKSIIISGSAAEYGIVDKKDIPVSEDTDLKATFGYGLSKLRETTLALNFRSRHKLPIVVARLFNPVGAGMHARLLIPSLLKQIEQIKGGQRQSIEVSRLDSKRDYINIKDVALGIKTLVEGGPKEAVYNIGSGESTSNQRLIELMLKNSRLSESPPIIETSKQPEPLAAVQANISRISNELGWRPRRTIEDTIREIVSDSK